MNLSHNYIIIDSETEFPWGLSIKRVHNLSKQVNITLVQDLYNHTLTKFSVLKGITFARK